MGFEMRSIQLRTLDVVAAACACSAAAAVALLPLGCDRPMSAPLPAASGDDAAPRRGGVLRLASFEAIRNLDPAGPADALSAEAQRLVFAGLVDYDDRGRLAPDLADRWEIADDGRVYRFVLRRQVLMHDGLELTADDVKRSVERALRRSTPNPNASYFAGIAGYRAFTSGQSDHLAGVVVEGRYTVSFHLDEPDATFLPMMTMITLRPVCRTAGDRYTDAWWPCGAGPFKLADWVPGSSLRIVRHDGYFRSGLPLLDAVEWTFGMQPSAQRFRFEHGELDVFRDLRQADQQRFAADPRWKPFEAVDPDNRVYGEVMNTRVAPFDNVEVRRAVAAAIDREHYRLLEPESITVLTQPIPRGVAGYDRGIEGQRFDYTAALEHMRKAGYPYDPATGRGGWPRPIVYPLYDRALLAFTAQLLEQDLARIGLRLELRLMSWQAFLAMQERPGAAAMSQGAWEMDYPDPSALFDPLFTTGAIPEAGHNVAFYSSRRLDSLVEQAHRELDPVRRRNLYLEADSIVCDDAPWAFVYGVHRFSVRQPYIRELARPVVGHASSGDRDPPRPLDIVRTWIDRAGDGIEHVLRGGLR